MIDVPPKRLGGETDPNAWHFSRLGEEGPLPNPVGHTFPLLTHDPDGKWRLVGTGFYISDGGFFVTARHVIEEVLEGSNQRAPLLILHLHSPTGLFGASEFHVRPIAQCWISDKADICLGVAATAKHKVTGEIMKNWTWTLSWEKPADRSLVHTYAFPNHIVVDDGRRIRFAPHAYSGRVLSTGEFRDRVMLLSLYRGRFSHSWCRKRRSHNLGKLYRRHQLYRVARELGPSARSRVWRSKPLFS